MAHNQVTLKSVTLCDHFVDQCYYFFNRPVSEKYVTETEIMLISPFKSSLQENKDPFFNNTKSKY